MTQDVGASQQSSTGGGEAEGSEHSPAAGSGQGRPLANSEQGRPLANSEQENPVPSVKQEKPALGKEQETVLASVGVEQPVSGAGKVVDSRRCVLCSMQGDADCMVSSLSLSLSLCVCQEQLCSGCSCVPLQEAGRLLPCTVDEWVHANCAVWSAEVYEECSGVLRDVHTAISRGTRLVSGL